MKQTKLNKPKYMMATKAIHKIGDISSDEPDICCVYMENETDYIGNWVTGLGFINVHFPKSTTRELTKDEIKYYNGLNFGMYSLMTDEKSYNLGSLNIEDSNDDI